MDANKENTMNESEEKEPENKVNLLFDHQAYIDVYLLFVPKCSLLQNMEAKERRTRIVHYLGFDCWVCEVVECLFVHY